MGPTPIIDLIMGGIAIFGFILIVWGVGEFSTNAPNGLMYFGAGITVQGVDGYLKFDTKKFGFAGTGGLVLIALGFLGSMAW